ncbi:hypothetical protein F7230_06120 [Corynebacterium sp. 320]|uniref:AMIN-like domain-containing (lipo)protein n=1 Tax=Corynebacterium TaxID=1716 RepID=UPI00125CB2AD|nr:MULTISPECIES: hypothetical protein [Corynebacterium]KAB1503109.1 hypothetical protein F7230_06120 [Corynebacterium sp. 320]KAB1551039.1 hypothetical protein F7232_08245 [Corynebacterium sp. 319]KAB3526906.1 hypothetical protein F8354_06120 [Corynebacterium sp. 250]KAB3538399.1 hypothetical protein F8390_09020 [Corynebacterium sp. 366]QNP92480.1 hypothetical protein IAU67_01195 [Corynebacterium zhongnanshanii]
MTGHEVRRHSRWARRGVAAALMGAALLAGACSSNGSGDGAGGSSSGGATSTVTESRTHTQTHTQTATQTATTTTRDGKGSGEVASDQAKTDTDKPGATMMGEASLDDRTQHPAAGSNVRPVAVRVGHHDGFDRVVIELEGSGPAGWYTRLGTTAAHQASGHPIDVAGQYALDLGVEMTPIDLEEAARQDGRTVLKPGVHPGTTTGDGEPRDAVVTEVNYAGQFEARSQFVIGLTRKVPYSVTYLDGPPRIVVDFKAR